MNQQNSSLSLNYSIYIHIPFCKKRCFYCDFVSTEQEPLFDLYTKALLEEIRLRKSSFQKGNLVSVYFGGGTPSLWPAHKLSEIIKSLEIKQNTEVEVTVEINPGDIDQKWLETLINAGVNRFSIGIQSLDDKRLKWLGRRHDSKAAIEAVSTVRAAGCKNLSLDFIYGLPGQSVNDAKEDILKALSLEPDHLSLYELTISEGTPLFEQKEKFNFPDHEQLAQMWVQVRDILLGENFEHYEVSNYAKIGFASLHNRHYWLGGQYMGIGAGAHGTLIKNNRYIRYSNTSDIEDYISFSTLCFENNYAGKKGIFETLTPSQRSKELIMMGLRTIEGVNMIQLRSLLSEKEEREFSKIFQQLEIEGYVVLCSNKIIPTVMGMAMADELVLRFF